MIIYYTHTLKVLAIQLVNRLRRAWKNEGDGGGKESGLSQTVTFAEALDLELELIGKPKKIQGQISRRPGGYISSRVPWGEFFSVGFQEVDEVVE